MTNPWLAASALSGLMATAAGAFGAHGLRDRLPPDRLGVFEIGVRYQMYHALALGLVGLLAARSTPGVAPSGWLFSAGTVLFSGSLYLLALTGHRWLGAVTPMGGLCLLAGWLALLVAALRPG
ncbi:MAG: DUF423 domain-containing protein [Myxococcales bacterium]|nr:DUF423 domain-containing protein [Myxococcota bacterium]MDW8280309.1 DUF423 domain-containing protein [Myxococcales bacterium]